MAESPTLRSRLYRLKVVIVALGSFIIGVALLTLAKFVDGRHGYGWLSFWPIGEIGGTLAAAGMFGIAWDYADGRDRDLREDERIRRLLKESAPEFRDAVIAGFTETPANMQAVATPETLDKLAANALGLRLGDPDFAAELYAGLLAQAIRTPERWYDVDVSIRLSRIRERSTDGAPRSKSVPAPLLDVVVTWEYSVTPSHAVQRFACTSDMNEFRDMVEDVPATSTWFMSPRLDVDPSNPENFELINFSVDGEERRPRRQVRKSGQTYSVPIGEDVVHAGRPVRIRHTYRAVADPANHRLFVTIAQPARNVHVDVDYSAAGISRMSVSDPAGGGGSRPYVSQLPAQAAGKELTIEVAGWVQAGTGLTFVWTLESEEQTARSTPARSAA